MTTQIVYVLVSSDNDIYLEELWASLYSLRVYHPESIVKVLVDTPTEKRINQYPALRDMITEIVIVDVPEHYSPKERSRQIKTTVRNVIDGAFLFIDTDTVICKSLDAIDNLICDIAAVPDEHLPLSQHPFGAGVYNNVKRIFDTDVTDSLYWFNSGIMYVADNSKTRDFYDHWNKNWAHSTFNKGDSQDQPALIQTDKEFGYMIERLPDIYNCQVAMSLKYFADAAIVHFWHMSFIPDQSYSPYFSLEIYKEIKRAGEITPEIKEQILNCKSTFTSPTMPVGIDQILFLFSSAGQIFTKIYKEGGLASFLMLKLANSLDKLHRLVRKNK